MKAPISSTKHYVQFTEFAVASASVTTNLLIDAVAVVDKNTPAEVEEGSIIKAVYIELWLLASQSTPGSFVVILEKQNGGISNPGFSNMTTLGDYRNKKNILYTTQGLLAENNSNPTPVMRQWFKIPKGKQRFGLDDQLKVQIAAIGAESIDGCSFATYKEYT